jgi:hypothetical protein
MAIAPNVYQIQIIQPLEIEREENKEGPSLLHECSQGTPLHWMPSRLGAAATCGVGLDVLRRDCKAADEDVDVL